MTSHRQQSPPFRYAATRARVNCLTPRIGSLATIASSPLPRRSASSYKIHRRRLLTCSQRLLMRPSVLCLLLALLAIASPARHATASGPTEGPFAHRGYYLTLTRTPTFGLDAWKRTIDCVRT